MNNKGKEIELEPVVYFGYVNIRLNLVMCVTNVVQLIAGLTGVAKVLPWSNQ